MPSPLPESRPGSSPGPPTARRRWEVLCSRPWVILCAFGALLWIVLRSGTKPSRLSYPCQQASLASLAAVLGPPLVAAVIATRFRTLRALRSGPGKAIAAGLALTVVIAVAGVSLSTSPQAGEAGLAPPPDHHPAVFLVDPARGPVAGRHGGVDDLVELMGRNGLPWHRSASVSTTSGPGGLIARDSFVLLKINAQWPERGGTNTDVLRGVIRRIVEHPDGFEGEVLVADNGQGSGSLDPARANASDTAQSATDVVGDFAREGWRVSALLWDGQRQASVDDFSSGDMRSGYVLSASRDAETGVIVSYPKFRTAFGTQVSYKHGVWAQGSGAFDPGRLVVINLPVLKTHSIYGVTACVKNHMGVVTRDLGTDSHNAIGRGGLGSFLAEVRLPDLNILDGTWILARPGSGPSAPYDQATRRDLLVASRDPVALDAWAVKSILVPAIVANGFEAYPNQDPENPAGAFRRYLDRSMNELLAAGIPVTNVPSAVDLRVWPDDAPPLFVRGDANGDGAVDIADAIATLLCLFLGQSMKCEDALDANDDGAVDISDPLRGLEFLFRDGSAPAAPFPDRGPDGTADDLGCSRE